MSKSYARLTSAPEAGVSDSVIEDIQRLLPWPGPEPQPYVRYPGTKQDVDYLYSRTAVARELGISRRRVEQIEKKALEKLRVILEDKGILSYEDL